MTHTVSTSRLFGGQFRRPGKGEAGRGRDEQRSKTDGGCDREPRHRKQVS